MASPFLPQEILDIIIDHVAEAQRHLGFSAAPPSALRLNVKTLKACCLVSHAFAQTAQPYLFSLLELSTDLGMSDLAKCRRIERREALVRLFEDKPHIGRGVRGVLLDWVRQDARVHVIQHANNDVDSRLYDALVELPNVRLLIANAGPLETGSMEWSPYLKIHKLPFHLNVITTLIVTDFNFDFAVCAYMPMLSYFLFSLVKFSPDKDLLHARQQSTKLFIREFKLLGSRESMLDVIADNMRGTGPRNHPLLDFSRVRSVELGNHFPKEGHHDDYKSSLWRLLGYCASSVDTLALTNYRLYEYDITQPFLPEGATDVATISLSHMHQLLNLTLRARSITLGSLEGHDALRDIIYLLDSLPRDNKLVSLTLDFKITSEEVLSLRALRPYTDWDALVACLNRTTNGSKLAKLEFCVDWTYLMDDHMQWSNDIVSDLLLHILFPELEANVVDALDEKPIKTLWTWKS